MVIDILHQVQGKEVRDLMVLSHHILESYASLSVSTISVWMEFIDLAFSHSYSFEVICSEKKEKKGEKRCFKSNYSMVIIDMPEFKARGKSPLGNGKKIHL